MLVSQYAHSHYIYNVFIFEFFTTIKCGLKWQYFKKDYIKRNLDIER